MSMHQHSTPTHIKTKNNSGQIMFLVFFAIASLMIVGTMTVGLATQSDTPNIPSTWQQLLNFKSEQNQQQITPTTTHQPRPNTTQQPKKTQVTATPSPNNNNDYQCPQKERVDCMPIISDEKIELPYCQPEYRSWIEENCAVTYTD